MTPSTKKCLLIFSLLLVTSNQSINCYQDPFTAFLEMFFGQQTRPRQSIDDHITTLRYNLQGLPQREIDDIARATRKALQNVDLNNSRLISDAINSELVTHVKEKVAQDVRDIAQQAHIKLDQRNRETIVNTYTNDFIRHIGTLTYIEGNNIKQYFGDSRIAAVSQLVYNAEAADLLFPNAPQKPTYNNSNHYYNNQPLPADMVPVFVYQPAPVKPAPTYVPNNREYNAQQNAEFIEQILKKAAQSNDPYASTFASNDMRQLKSFIVDSTLSITHIPANDRLAHTKNGLAQLLDTKLETARKNLQPKLKFPYKLQPSLETTRASNLAAIQSWQEQEISRDRIAAYFGNNFEGKSNIEEDIIKNMGIICPVCSELFKEEHCHGTVNKEVNNCGHEVCKGCMQDWKKNCPVCRGHV